MSRLRINLGVIGSARQVSARTLSAMDRAQGRIVATYVRVAKQVLSVSAGGAFKKARRIRRTGGAVRRGQYRRDVSAGLSRGLSLTAAHVTARSARARREVEYEKFRHSLPGEPPRLITGNLRSSVQIRKEGPVHYAAVLLPQAIYGWWLDQGYTHKSGRRVLRRPWIYPALKLAEPAILDIVKGALRSV